MLLLIAYFQHFANNAGNIVHFYTPTVVQRLICFNVIAGLVQITFLPVFGSSVLIIFMSVTIVSSA